MKIAKTKNVKKIIMVGIIVALVIVGVIIVSVKKSETKNKIIEYTQYDYVKSIIDTYNESVETVSDEVSLIDNGNDIVVMISDFVETEEGGKHMSIMNYTTMKISSIIYDKDNNPTMVANMTVDENYNVSNVTTYAYSTGDINTYQSDDEKMVEFKKIAESVSKKFKKIVSEAAQNGVELFNKSLNDLKLTEYKK